jgi:hypothetical protein
MAANKPIIVPVNADDTPLTIAKPGEFDLEKFKAKRSPSLAGVETLLTALPHHHSQGLQARAGAIHRWALAALISPAGVVATVTESPTRQADSRSALCCETRSEGPIPDRTKKTPCAAGAVNGVKASIEHHEKSTPSGAGASPAA